MKKYMLYSEKEKLAKEYETWCDDIDLSLNDVKIARTNVVNVISFLLEKGYRKASDVIDEFVERLKEENEISLRRYGKGIGMTAIFKIADEMKFELFKQQEDKNER